jgi:hypothetical protein
MGFRAPTDLSPGEQDRQRRIEKLKRELAEEERAQKAEASRPFRPRQDMPKMVATGGIDRAKLAKRLFQPDGETEKQDEAWREAMEYDPHDERKRRPGR